MSDDEAYIDKLEVALSTAREALIHFGCKPEDATRGGVALAIIRDALNFVPAPRPTAEQHANLMVAARAAYLELRHLGNANGMVMTVLEGVLTGPGARAVAP